MRLLALIAIVPAAATLYFFLFWRWFHYWRKHRVQVLSMMLGMIGGFGAAVWLLRAHVFAHRLAVPSGVQAAGWVLLAVVTVFGTVADRQIGFRVRSFTPFFDDDGRIELKTTGAYGVVRHPIYASGIGFQLAVFLITGYLAVAAALVIFAAGALWFTRQEEHRLMSLLDDPSEYVRYRARVPALLPWLRR